MLCTFLGCYVSLIGEEEDAAVALLDLKVAMKPLVSFLYGDIMRSNDLLNTAIYTLKIKITYIKSFLVMLLMSL